MLRGSNTPLTVGKIICIGQNYAEHAKEMKFDIPSSPVFFLKPPSAIIHDGGEIVMPSISKNVQHEVELTVLIGTGGSNIPVDKALEHVAGYGVGLDMTMRDVQLEAKTKGLPWTLAKGFDTSAPLSDFIPASTTGTPHALRIQLTIHGTMRQASSLDQLIFPVEALIAYVSRFITLESGDVIYTGTPEGVSAVAHGDSLDAALLDSRGALLTSLHVRVR
jgi:5-carboxymethyl-2-hydroxymuconate isomerase